MRRCPRCSAEFDDAAEFCHKDGHPLERLDEARAPDPYLGQVLFDQFEVQSVLGTGGMGTVYKALQRGIDRYVAVKVLNPELVRDADVAHRFKREARLVSRVENPHLVTVYLFGELPDGNLCMVMEFLDGPHLARVLRDAGPMPVARVAHILGQVGDAVGEVHALGIVHRDLKPENIMLVRRSGDPDFAKVLDFGIARQIDARSHATQHGLVFGTARYISPEAARGEVATSRSDVYSLGVIAYEMLTGEPPFRADSAMALLVAHVQDEPPPLAQSSAGREVPSPIDGFVLRCLSKNPDERPADARVFAETFRDIVREAGVAPLPARPRIPSQEIPTTAVHAAAVEEEREVPEEPLEEGFAEAREGPEGARVETTASVPFPVLPVHHRGRWVLAGVAIVVLAVTAFVLLRGRPGASGAAQLVRRADIAFAEDRIGGPGGAIALTDEALARRPDLASAIHLRRRMALALLERARQAEREGRVAAAIMDLGLYERLRPDDAEARERRERLEASLHADELPVGVPPPEPGTAGGSSAPRPRTTRGGVPAPTVRATVSVRPARVIAGDAVTFVAVTEGAGDEPASEPHFHVSGVGRTKGFSTNVEDVRIGGSGRYSATFVFPAEGQYEVAFASQVGGGHVEGVVLVNVVAPAPTPPVGPGTAEPDGPTTAAPATAAPATAAPATAAPATAAPATAAPAPSTSGPSDQPTGDG